MGRMCSQYWNSATTGISAGWIFESRVHQLLRSQQTIQLFPVTLHSSEADDFIYKGYSRKTPTDLQLPESDEDTLVKGCDFYANRYYRLVSADFPEVHSLLLICPPDGSSPLLLIFHITRTAKAHDASEETLRSIDNLDLPKDTRKYYVVVTPEGVEPEVRVPRSYFGRRGRTKLRDKVLRVFTYPVPFKVLLLGYCDAL